MIEERVPPQNIEAEQAVLGAMLIDKEAIAKATELLSADDFYREAHRVIFSAMLELYNKNEAVDMVTVTEILKRDNKLEDIGGIAYITSLANVVLTAANVKYHADIVAEKSVLRQLVRVSTEIAAMGYEANVFYLPDIIPKAKKQPPTCNSLREIVRIIFLIEGYSATSANSVPSCSSSIF